MLITEITFLIERTLFNLSTILLRIILHKNYKINLYINTNDI